MNIRQAKLTLNAHKHNLLNHFAATGMFMLNNVKTTTTKSVKIKRDRQTEEETDRQTDRQTDGGERETD